MRQQVRVLLHRREPAVVRSSLHLRDDDFRLSFTYGSYVTLTNLGPRGSSD
jgi:NifB/MoaA-like Fe-S oxidoreductase